MASFGEQSETGLQLLARLGSRVPLNGLEPSLFGDGPVKGTVYEFHGDEGCAKSEMCLNLTMKCILPSTWKGVHLDGKNAEIVFVDTELKFSILRLTTIMDSYIQKAIDKHKSLAGSMGSYENVHTIVEKTFIESADKSKTTVSKSSKELFEDPTSSCNNDVTNANNCISEKLDDITSDSIEEFIKDCLTHLYIIQTTTYFQLLMSLNSLEELISNHPKISLLVIDSMSSYYWIMRSDNGGKFKDIEDPMKKIVAILSSLAHNFGLITISTTASLFSNKRKTSEDSRLPLMQSWDFMGKSWNSFIKYRLVFSKRIRENLYEYTVDKDKGKSNSVSFTVNDDGVCFN